MKGEKRNYFFFLLLTDSSINFATSSLHIRNVLGQTYNFQVSLDTHRFNTGMQSFRVAKVFQTPLSAKVKIYEKEDDDVDIVEDNAPANPKEFQM